MGLRRRTISLPFLLAVIELSSPKDKEDFLRVPEGVPCLECLFSGPVDEYIVSREINFCHPGGLSLEM